MSDLYIGIYTFLYLCLFALMRWQDRIHRKEIEEIHENYDEKRQKLLDYFAEERRELLDRIMANNITEFKTARNEANVKRSENGNFIKDQMDRAVQKYVDMD
jgi:hypothetical protein